MIKLVAIITMLIDHIGLVFFPPCWALRLIGRISMPLFAYGTAKGFAYSRKNKTLVLYVMRLAIFGVISQIPYMWMVGDNGALNIGFTWALAVCLLAAVVPNKTTQNDKPDWSSILMRTFAVLTVLSASVSFNVSYGTYGVCLPSILYFGLIQRKQYIRTVVIFSVICIANTVLYNGFMLNIFGALAFPVIALLEHTQLEKKVRLPKALGYAVYPVHMALFALVRYLVEK